MIPASPEGDAPAGLGGSAPGDQAEPAPAEAAASAERESRFANTLIESMPGILYLYNQEGRFLRWNRNFERVSGYGAAELPTMHPLDLFQGQDRRRVAERIGEVFEKGESSVEATLVTRDGRALPYFFTGKRIEFDGALCLVGMGLDTSERQRAEQALRKSEERYRTTLESILEGCQLIDFDWRYVYLNEAAALQNRRPNAELLGQRMPEAWPGIEDTHIFALLARCMNERIAAHEETEFAFPDGSKGWFDVRIQPVPEGIFVLSIDISERKQAERALRDLNECLEQKVVDRTVDLEIARERAEAADRIKSAFLATMSHELRTPLNSIIGFTGIMLQSLAGPLTPEQAKQLGMVQRSARHLLELINDVLDISKIEAGQVEVHRGLFDLAPVVEEAAATVRPQAEKKGLALHVEVPPGPLPMNSDRRRVGQILLNLMNNAIKFTDQGGVTVTTLIRDDFTSPGAGQPCRATSIRVEDTGIGIKAQDLSTLFQPFRQVDSGLQRQHEGTGLGLAICRRLTDLLEGTVTVESTWGRGTAFTVTLPLGPKDGSPP